MLSRKCHLVSCLHYFKTIQNRGWADVTALAELQKTQGRLPACVRQLTPLTYLLTYLRTFWASTGHLQAEHVCGTQTYMQAKHVYTYKIIIFKTLLNNLKGLSSSKHWLLFQRIQVQFPALTQQLTTAYNSSPRRSDATVLPLWKLH